MDFKRRKQVLLPLDLKITSFLCCYLTVAPKGWRSSCILDILKWETLQQFLGSNAHTTPVFTYLLALLGSAFLDSAQDLPSKFSGKCQVSALCFLLYVFQLSFTLTSSCLCSRSMLWSSNVSQCTQLQGTYCAVHTAVLLSQTSALRVAPQHISSLLPVYMCWFLFGEKKKKKTGHVEELSADWFPPITQLQHVQSTQATRSTPQNMLFCRFNLQQKVRSKQRGPAFLDTNTNISFNS